MGLLEGLAAAALFPVQEAQEVLELLDKEITVGPGLLLQITVVVVVVVPAP